MSDVATKLPDRIYTYVQTTTPGDAVEGESWFDPSSNDAKVYDGEEFVDLTITDHGQLDGVDAADHHDPVSVDGDTLARTGQVLSVPDGAVTAADLAPDSVGASELAFNTPLGSQNGRVTVALANALEVDANGRIAVSAESITDEEVDDGSLTESSLAGGTITDASVADNSLTESSLAGDSVGASELAYNVPLGSQNGRVTVALGDALGVDGDGRLYIPDAAINSRELSMPALAGDAVSAAGGQFGIATDGVQPRHTDNNQFYDINVDRVDGNDAADLEQTAKKNALAADFVL